MYVFCADIMSHLVGKPGMSAEFQKKYMNAEIETLKGACLATANHLGKEVIRLRKKVRKLNFNLEQANQLNLFTKYEYEKLQGDLK